jgi:hypothetical protein
LALSMYLVVLCSRFMNVPFELHTSLSSDT